MPALRPHRRFRLRPVLAALAFAFSASPILAADAANLTVVSWASLRPQAAVAPNSTAVVQGEFSTRAARTPDGAPLPEMDSFSVAFEGADGIAMPAGIFAVEPDRIVILVPDLPDGEVRVKVMRDGAEIGAATIEVAAVSPGLFSADSSGTGLAAAVAVRVDLEDWTVATEDVAFFNGERGRFEPILINPGTRGNAIFLDLLGTGIRNAKAVEAVIGDVPVPAHLREAPGPTPGLDVVTLGPLPVSLARRETLDVRLVADGIHANPVQIAFSPSTGEAVTFSNQIVRLAQGRCQTCHRPGEVAPFSALDFESVRPWAHAIKEATQAREMPPWKPVAGYGEFVEERRLSESEIGLIARWVEAGSPEGDPEDLPEPMEFDSDWALGQPDLVLETPAYIPDPSLSDDYRCFSIPVGDFPARRSITGIEVQPGNRGVVHHVLLFGDPQGESLALEERTVDGQPGYTCFGSAKIDPSSLNLVVDSYVLGGWAPGMRPLTLREGTGLSMQPGGRIAVQVHYHTGGHNHSDEATGTDSTRIGIHFSEVPTPKNALMVAALNTGFLIPAGAPRHEVRAHFDFTSILGSAALGPLGKLLADLIFPLEITAVLPHMHLLGREIRMDKISSTGESTPMILIDDWDFNWQSFYTFVEPIPFAADDRLEVVAFYDNSETNPLNPNSPPIDVGWGDGTEDEMLLVFVQVDVPDLCAFGLCGD